MFNKFLWDSYEMKMQLTFAITVTFVITQRILTFIRASNHSQSFLAIDLYRFRKLALRQIASTCCKFGSPEIKQNANKLFKNCRTLFELLLHLLADRTK